MKRPVWPTLTPTPTPVRKAPPRPAQPAAIPSAYREAAAQAAAQTAAQTAAAKDSAPLITSQEQAQTRSAQIVDEARLEAARILQDAANEAEKAEAAAREQGFAEGRQEGLRAAEAESEALKRQGDLELQNARLQADAIRQAAEAQAALTRVEAEKAAQAALAEAKEEAQRIIAEAQQEGLRRIENSQSALIELSVSAATRLVQGHLALQPQAIIQMIAAGLRRLKDTQATVRVSPEDLPLLEAQRSTLERELGAGALTLSPDATLHQGSYLINSPLGQVDGTLEHQTERLQAAMRAALGGSGS